MGNTPQNCIPSPPPTGWAARPNQFNIPQMPGPNDQPPWWIQWFDAAGVAHACFPGFIEADNLPGGSTQTAQLGLSGVTEATVTIAFNTPPTSGKFNVQVFNLGDSGVTELIAWANNQGDSSGTPVYLASFHNPDVQTPSLTTWTGLFETQVPISALNMQITLNTQAGPDGIAVLTVTS